MNSNVATAPFSRAVVSAMRKLYPEKLADKSWDNTGLLLEAPFDPLRRQMNSVLLTIDLTTAVVDEAIERDDSVIVAYHPIIFRGLKSLTLENSQQRSLLRLAAKGISVYSPHSAIDAAPGGLGDWLADIVTGTPVNAPEPQDEEQQDTDAEVKPTPLIEEEDPFVDRRPVYLLQHHPSQRKISKPADLKLDSTKHTRTAIKPSNISDIPGAGLGRIIRFEKPQKLSAIIERIARGVGNPKGFPIAIPQGRNIGDIKIQSVALCAGSGGSLFEGLDDVDLLFTGELTHHEALAAIERGQCVVTLFHSNSERGFLHNILKAQLLEKVKEEWQNIRKEELSKDGVSEELLEALEDEFVSVEVSEKDRDPYGLVIAKAEI
ncbi:NGG1p interacting factor 3 [Tothia fuscella]|uniref:NGG1p interacting factor 3 n=1 Tax=Tothia fuscella TaxID=1048955 RepID=A0A9P4P3Z7_9PEZI|nr:NGG1p interacting factor 3 [Tothia fuscella]